ncbi:hypothetical protein Dsin_007656 [Dipteronia sinensis]|uniref:DUF629 domain-containing protein n=1 Tax=Dipteronia sinensis TaxID=43782 RepID=A0AAE0B257_9ROSI|nr:hypothetical protein Dsin_007656 [Dipteronia sinensis]
MGCRSYWILGEEYMKESVDLVTNGVWKPVDTNPMKSKNNDSSKGPKWAFCDDDIVRLLILGKIRSTFALLHKNKCLAPINIRWAIEYTENQFESMYPLSQYLNLGAKSLQIIRLLRASQLTEVQAFLEVVARAGRLSENVETDNYIDDEISDHHLFDIKERVLFSRDFTCLVLDERVLRGELNVTNYFDAVAGDHSSADECGDDVVIPASDDIVSWLYMDSNCREVLRSWTSLREARRRQAKKSHGVQLKKLSVLPKVCAKIEENPGKLVAVQIIEHMFFEETKRREESPEYEPELYIDLLKKREKKLQEMNKSFVKSEIAVISEVLKQVEEVQYGFEGSNKQEHTKRIDYCVGKALRRLKLKLIKDLTIHDTVILRRLALFNQYKLELTNISVCDYRSIVVPILKEFLQSHLKDLYEDAEKKSEAAEKALLADIANEEADKESKDVKQNQDKKKKKKKKNKKKINKNPETSKESEQCDSKNGDSLDEPKQSTAADEAQMLDEYLENQRRFEEEDDDQGQWILIKKKKKKYKSQDSFEKKINKDSANVKQKQYEKKKKKNTNPKKDKESEGTNDSKQFDLHQKGVEQDDTTNSKSNDSLGELKQLTVSDEERMLAKYLENQRQFERQASVKVNVSGNRLEKLLGDSVSVDVSENSSAIEESMLKEPSEYQRQIDNNEAKQKCIVEKSKNIGETIGRNAVEGVSDFSPERLLGDSVSVDVSENSSAIEERMLEEPSEYQRQIDDDEAKQKCIAEKPKNIGETIGGNAEEGVSDYSLESNHEEYEKRFLHDIEKAICLSLDCFEKRYGTLLPTDVNNGKTSRLDVQLYVIMQSQWYLRQIRDEFMSIVPNKTHTHAGDPCFRCAYSDTFAARRIASRYVPEEVVQLSSRIFYPVQDYFVEWLTEQNPANKVIGISSSACQLKQQLVDVVRKIVVDLENERQINNDDTEKDFAEQNTA